MDKQVLLRMENIEHCYGSCKALCGVDFSLYRGEIHALAGDHRSGKTTLGKILSGAVRKQRGRLFLDGDEVTSLNIRKAIQLGIGMVYQGESLVPSLNAVDNIFCGVQPNFFLGKRDRLAMIEESRRLLDLFQVSVALETPFYKMDAKDKQIIQICHVLSRRPRILIIDEIGTSMPPSELELVFRILKGECGRGLSIIYITSNFGEVFKVADRVTIMKDGFRTGTEAVGALDPARLIDMAYTAVLSSGGDFERSIRFDSFQESIIEELPLGEIILDSDARLIMVNKRASCLLPPSGNDYKGIPFGEAFPQLESRHLSRILDAIAAGRSANVEGAVVGDKVLKFTLGPILDNRKNRIGTNIFIEDMSVSYQTREYLTEATKAASVAELAAGVAHEIKNPLAIVQNYVELLKITRDEDERGENIQRIERELHRITEIIGSLLSFSRMKHTTFNPTSLRMLLEEVLMLLGHNISRKRIRLVKEFSSDPILQADENKLKQLFMNLVVNAIDAVLDEGSIRVALVDRATDHTVTVIVSDNGHGISPDVREKIFEPFFTTKMSRTNIGLGLAICRNIVELHGGVIKLVSLPAWKTSFAVTFPVIPRRTDE